METASAIASSSSTLPVHCRDDDGHDGKQVVVRVRRKRQQAPIDALWLEINERPHKGKHQERYEEMGLTLAQLSLADGQDQGQREEEGKGEGVGMAKRRKLLFHHVETVSPSDEEKGFLESILLNAREDGKSEQRHMEQREDIKKSKDKQDQLRASARKKHEYAAKHARFEQVWRSRKGIAEAANENAIRELCHLYDVVRVDMEEEMEAKPARKAKAKSETVSDHERQILCNFLPMMREYLPSAAAEVEAQLCSSGTTEQEDYVYDVYTLGKEENVAEDVVADYPLVQVEEEDGFYYGDMVESEVDTDDSNDENNPMNDYPSEEESELDEKCQSHFSNEFEEEDPFDEDDEDSDASESNEEARKWTYRR